LRNVAICSRENVAGDPAGAAEAGHYGDFDADIAA
jgi:hypothetical protein